MAFPGSKRALLGSPTYIGPGDIVPGAAAWYGLRAYSSSVASKGTQKAVNIRRASDNASMDILILKNGTLDTASASAFLSSTTGFVTKWYDQSGNARDASQGTAATQPRLTFNVINTLPGVSYSGAQALIVTTVTSVAQPWTVAAVANKTNTSNNVWLFSNNPNWAVGWGTDPKAAIFAGSIANGATASDNAFHAIQFTANGASSITNVDGSSTTISPGTNAIVNNFGIGSDNTGVGGRITGFIEELGIWPGNVASLIPNQRTYYGTP